MKNDTFLFSPTQGGVEGVMLYKSLLRICQTVILELCPNLCSAEGGPELSWLFVLEKAAKFLGTRKWKIIFCTERMLAENRMESGGARR